MLLAGIRCTPSLVTPTTARAFAAVRELWATQLRVKDTGKTFEVEFNTGERFSLPAEYLRVESPAAGNQDARDAFGRPKVVHGRRHVSILDVEPVGSYAVRLSFDDLHSHGIYTWPLLHDLGSHKLSRMRRYLRALGDRGLSRDPPALLHRRQRASGEGGAMQQQQQQQDAGDASGAGGGVAANGTNGSTSAAGSRIPGSSSGDSSGTSVSREGAGQRGKQQRGNGGGGGSSAPNPG